MTEIEKIKADLKKLEDFKEMALRLGSPIEIQFHLLRLELINKLEEAEKQPKDLKLIDPDPVNHPKHYTSHPSGVECIDVIEHMLCNMANAIKYIWRADLKCDAIEDLEKAVWYLNREINRRKKAQSC